MFGGSLRGRRVSVSSGAPSPNSEQLMSRKPPLPQEKSNVPENQLPDRVPSVASPAFWGRWCRLSEEAVRQ